VGTVAVVLAAGGGRRFRGPDHKLLVLVDGVAVVRWAVDAARTAAIGPVLVVVGAVDLTGVLPDDVTIVANADWARGQASSLRAGVAAAAAAGADAVVVGLGDVPGVPPEAWRAVAGARGPIATASFDGVPSPPVRLERSVWDDLPADGDEGARVLLRSRPELVTEVPVAGSPADVDVVADLDGVAGGTDRHDPSRKRGSRPRR
jgi:molybdenum cofactor cytidylyltransferase